MADSVTEERPAKERTRYEDDYYTWVLEQVALLRAGRLDEVDAENIAEELSDIPSALFDRLQFSLKVLLMHMLKWDRQPEHRTRTWVFSIHEQRRRVQRLLNENPGLRSRLDEALEEGYEYARPWAALETVLVESEFPEECPTLWTKCSTVPSTATR
jgi:hypothetical protein